ncbi:uncharacterized protein G2W53_025189 [Senna tora]|uniref:Uncharacterized protein n=1 Tax=Senna tora TaxID=362788 RepID=A0A834TLQ9_9FABA|nr:uncharacterized protein G2W53_025189 [Senna tora]
MSCVDFESPPIQYQNRKAGSNWRIPPKASLLKKRVGQQALASRKLKFKDQIAQVCLLISVGLNTQIVETDGRTKQLLWLFCYNGDNGYNLEKQQARYLKSPEHGSKIKEPRPLPDSGHKHFSKEAPWEIPTEASIETLPPPPPANPLPPVALILPVPVLCFKEDMISSKLFYMPNEDQEYASPPQTSSGSFVLSFTQLAPLPPWPPPAP